MKTKYEYEIVDKATGYIISAATTRQGARREKKFAKRDYSWMETDIIQRKYVLAEEKVVR